MKFSQQLKFNSVPEWKEDYMNYAQLKKMIYQEEAILQVQSIGGGRAASEMRAGIARARSDVEEGGPSAEQTVEANFRQAVQSDVSRVLDFYRKKEAELVQRLALLEVRIEQEQGDAPNIPLGSTSEEATVATPLISRLSPNKATSRGPRSPLQKFASAGAGLVRSLTRRSMDSPRGLDRALSAVPDAGTASRLDLSGLTQRSLYWSQETGHVIAEREKLRGELTELYVAITGLQEYLTLNLEGFRKILKKHDKVVKGLTTSDNLSQTEFPAIRFQFEAVNKSVLQEANTRLVNLYAVVCSGGLTELALLDLRRQHKERLVFDRTTVWKDMVEAERKRASAHVEEEEAPAPWWTRHWSLIAVTFSLLVFGALLWAPTFPEPEQRACLALLVFVSCLWCTEALPLFATSMLVPLLVVVLGVLVDRTKKPPHRLTPKEAAPAIFKSMMSQVIMLLLASFAIAAALSKHFIAKWLASGILSRVGTVPSRVLLAVMFVATFASMWISNVAAPVLCFSLVAPILRTLDWKDNFAKSLILGIALASNIGGMTSPIASPQNLFAIQQMSVGGDPPSWLAWFAVSLPVSVVGVLICWIGLLLAYRPFPRPVRQLHEVKGAKIKMVQVYVVVVSVVTVGLWCANGYLAPVFGEMGVIAIIPLVAFFGTGVLNKDDFNAFLWNVVMLAMGGMALGQAVDSSGLLLTISHKLQQAVQRESPWAVLCIFCGLVLVATTFVSHTVGAIVILPILRAVGEAMPDPHPKMLVMGAALMCSGAMGLPVSGFPNMNAISVVDKTGREYLRTHDFLRVGVPCSICTYGVIVSLGYVLMTYVNGW